MRVEVLANDDALSRRATEVVANLVRRRPAAVLGLPTGGTPVGFYRELVRSGVSFRQVWTFNLDEYVGLGRSHPQSYYAYMKRHLYDHVDLDPGRTHIPDGMALDWEAECRRYEALIRKAGGLDLVVLGLGHNGHIGFNEPGTPWNSRTRRVRLAEQTRQANARFFGSADLVPAEAITMGIGTILEARRILLLASGPAKASTVRRVLEGPPDTSVPATALQTHSDVTVLLDRPAAALLQMSDGRAST